MLTSFESCTWKPEERGVVSEWLTGKDARVGAWVGFGHVEIWRRKTAKRVFEQRWEWGSVGYV